MSNPFRRIYDKFISTIKDVREKLVGVVEPEREPERIPVEIEPRVPMHELPVVAGLIEPIEVRPWSSIAYLDATANRFRETRTGLFMMGGEYRSKLSAWRSGMLDSLIYKNFPFLDAGERAIVIDAIENVRASDLTNEEKDEIIRDLIGSP